MRRMRWSVLRRTVQPFSCLALLTALALALLAAPTLAQDRPPLGEFNVMRFTPVAGPGSYFGVEGGSVRGMLEGSAGLVIDYAHQPFTLYDAECSDPADPATCNVVGSGRQIVSYTAAAHLMGSIALWDRLQIGLVLPLVITEGQSFALPSMPGNILEGGSGFAIGDPRLSVRGNILDDSSGLRLAASLFVTAPTGQAMAPHRYIGDRTPTFGGQAIVELVNSGFHIAGNIGGIWRDGDTLFSTVARAQLTYGLAMAYDITPLVDVFVEATGATSFSGEVDENPLEARLGARLRVDDIVLSLGGGAGIIAGLGVPQFRVLGRFMWAPSSVDAESDGINDAVDSCPTDAEDRDDWIDTDGCPESDNDDDGILDAADNCPNEAEDMDGDNDTDGCPDQDTDGDGIHDGYDSCPNDPEDVDGDRDEDGCPEEGAPPPPEDTGSHRRTRGR